MDWVDDIQPTHVYANCDTEKEIRFAMETFGAKGVGLCRTEHMFLASPIACDVFDSSFSRR